MDEIDGEAGDDLILGENDDDTIDGALKLRHRLGRLFRR